MHIQQQNIGNTGIKVSVIGLGTTKYGRNEKVKYPHPFAIPNDAQLVELLETAQALGINLIDTAPAYGNSEERIGELFKKKKMRKEWVISTKVGEEFVNGESIYDFTPEAARLSIERSLRRLYTDYLDIVLVHSDGNDIYNIEHFGIFQYLAELKQQGLIRAFGMSTKTAAGGIRTIQEADIAMVGFNALYTAERPAIQEAYKLNKGILVKKALDSGYIQKFEGAEPIKTALSFILQEPGVSSIILGTINPEHLRQNVAAITTIPSSADLFSS